MVVGENSAIFDL